jgi:hypothetical protein
MKTFVRRAVVLGVALSVLAGCSKKPEVADEEEVVVEVAVGVPVEGKPGYVTSPFAPNEGYVDLRGFETGMEVKCPFTGKIFLVP